MVATNKVIRVRRKSTNFLNANAKKKLSTPAQERFSRNLGRMVDGFVDIDSSRAKRRR